MTSSCCPKELNQQSQFSPGKIQNDETILYVVLDPLQWKNGRLSNAAFSKSKLKQGSLSISRYEFTSAEQLSEAVINPQISKEPTRKLVGVMKANCQSIRSLINDKGLRTVCVIDDGFQDDPAHGVLAFSEKVNQASKSVLAAYRATLMKTFGEPCYSLNEVFYS